MAIRVNSIEEAVADGKKRGEAAIRAAINKAASMGADDIHKFAISCIDKYYANYPPSIYDRTSQLYNTVSPVNEVSESGGMASMRIGVEFNAGGLGTHYHSTRWGTSTGVPDGYSEVILNNFLDGIHPRTDGSPKKGASYLPVQDGASTDTLLKEYLEQYKTTLSRLVSSYFVTLL